ncbi:MAG: hypothetical protein R2911_26255 [Caldilineaceae bacterium]
MVEIDADAADSVLRVLTGLIQGPDLVGMTAQAIPPAGLSEIDPVPIDEFGNFSISGLRPGAYQLVIGRNDPPLEIHVQNLEI